jgi:hypothetical protein
VLHVPTARTAKVACHNRSNPMLALPRHQSMLLHPLLGSRNRRGGPVHLLPRIRDDLWAGELMNAKLVRRIGRDFPQDWKRLLLAYGMVISR